MRSSSLDDVAGCARRLFTLLAGIVVVTALAGCQVFAHATDSSSSVSGGGGSSFNPASLSCRQLQAQGGELLPAASQEIADTITHGSGKTQTVATEIQQILIMGCRQEPGSFHPRAAAIKQYHEDFP